MSSHHDAADGRVPFPLVLPARAPRPPRLLAGGSAPRPASPPRAARGGARAAAHLAVALGAALSLPAAAQDVLVSLSSDATIGALEVHDDELVRHAPFLPAIPGWPRETFAAHVSPADPTTPASVPGDVDAVCDLGVGELASERVVFSLVSSELGVLDGDVVRLAQEGLVVVVPESVFVTAIGSLDGDVDVDAVHIEEDGTVLFSLTDDEDSGVLSGDEAGKVKDGAILELAPPSTLATILYTESQVDALVASALGLTPSIGDVKGLCRWNGQILFSVQSPSSDDATVFTDAGGGMVLSGHQEADLGFSGTVELDALTVHQAPSATLVAEAPQPAPGDDVTFALHGGQPGDVYTLLAAFELGPSFVPDAGWGGLVLATDAMLAASLVLTPQLALTVDGNGFSALAVALPATVGPLDVVVQAVRWAPERRSTNPILVEVGQ